MKKWFISRCSNPYAVEVRSIKWWFTKGRSLFNKREMIYFTLHFCQIAYVCKNDMGRSIIDLHWPFRILTLWCKNYRKSWLNDTVFTRVDIKCIGGDVFFRSLGIQNICIYYFSFPLFLPFHKVNVKFQKMNRNMNRFCHISSQGYFKTGKISPKL